MLENNPDTQRLHTFENLDLISHRDLIISRIRLSKSNHTVNADLYNLFPLIFFPQLKNFLGHLKYTKRLNLDVVSAGLNPVITFRKAVRKLKNLKNLSELKFNCSTLLRITKGDMEVFVSSLKPLLKMKRIKLNFTNSSMTTLSLNVLYSFHAFPKLESLILKLPSRKFILESGGLGLESLLKKCREFAAYKKRLTELEFTVKHSQIDGRDIRDPQILTGLNESSDYNQYIGIISKFNHIEKLKLHFTKRISEDTFDLLISNLACLKKIKSLELRLENDRLDASQIRKIFQTIKSLNPKELRLQINLDDKISESLHQALLELKHLEAFKLKIQNEDIDFLSFDAIIDSLKTRNQIRELSIDWSLDKNLSMPKFYSKILEDVPLDQFSKLTTLEIFDSHGTIDENVLIQISHCLQNKFKLRNFGIRAGVIDKNLPEKTIVDFLKSIPLARNLEKLTLDIPLPYSNQEIVSQLFKILKRLRNLDKLFVYCPFPAQQIESIKMFYNEVLSNKTLRRFIINFPYMESLPSILKGRSRKFFVKDITWNQNYRIVYEIYPLTTTVYFS